MKSRFTKSFSSSAAQFSEALSDVFFYLGQYRGRTLMTMFGIVWGTVTMVVLLACGSGVKRAMSKNMHGMGEGIVIIWPGRTSLPFQGYGGDRAVRLVAEDAVLLKREIPTIASCSPEYMRRGTPVRVGDKVNLTNTTGVIPEYGPMRNIWPQPGGRWLNDLDEVQRRRVCFLGNRLKELLFGEERAEGRYVLIGDVPFLVVGVLQKKTQPSSYGTRDQDRVFIPAATFAAVFSERYLNNIVYKPADPRLAPAVQKEIYRVLGKKYVFDPSDKECLFIWDTTEMDKFIFFFALGMNLFLGLIGVVTLVVGGIGLANIMYIGVEEQVPEIGIRRSVGARRRHILGRFLLEAGTMIGMGAVIGFGVAALLIRLIALLPIEEYLGVPQLSWRVLLVAVLALGATGFLAGYFPARRAASLPVVDCLRARG
ncbi:MAG: ABC transporter permease [Candidatus Oleimicrobiaceae bacterium]